MVTPGVRKTRGGAALECTLLELVNAVGFITEDDRQTVAIVRQLVRSRRVRLIGSFRGDPLALN